MAEKLSEAQRRVLAYMAEGAEAWTLGGLTSSAFWASRTTGNAQGRPPKVGLATLHALRHQGRIDEYERNWQGAKYRITPAGRAALEDENG